jgi:hypothetical protein
MTQNKNARLGWWALAVGVLTLSALSFSGLAGADEKIGKVQQGLVGGREVDETVDVNSAKKTAITLQEVGAFPAGNLQVLSSDGIRKPTRVKILSWRDFVKRLLPNHLRGQIIPKIRGHLIHKVTHRFVTIGIYSG